ncbi:hypothetical protein E1N52_33510 [Paraburkholderia guartelaensis]|uniref:Uncharacterized protein n=1 Tax=Paraburkholderia guartelaensis TaxID=2546446 RepID=A0A4R5L4P3_9BURK|nr:hypothetical protein [Paraburkholderia guartelaensis]TDG03698.1 hypothetical protein E1N52_33510 [Paraburkholderia guartelaensis]
MDRTELLEQIRRNAPSIVAGFLPLGAQTELDRVIRDGRHEVDTNAYLMFVSLRAMLRKAGMPSFDSDSEAAQIMALLKT